MSRGQNVQSKGPTHRTRASALCINNEQILSVFVRDPVTKAEFWILPGGGLENGETPEQAAVRETLEETAVEIKVLPDLVVVRTYPFVWGGKEFITTTHFFRVRLLRDPLIIPPNRENYILKHEWLPQNEAIKLLGQPSSDISRALADLISLPDPQFTSR